MDNRAHRAFELLVCIVIAIAVLWFLLEAIVLGLSAVGAEPLPR